MIHKSAFYVAEFLEQKKFISEYEKGIYVYGMEIIFSTIISNVLIITEGIILGDIWGAVLFIAIVRPLRKTVGGYHASTHATCCLMTMFMFGFSEVICVCIKGRVFLEMMLFLITLKGVWTANPDELLVDSIGQKAVENNMKRKKSLLIFYSIIICIGMITNTDQSGNVLSGMTIVDSDRIIGRHIKEWREKF